MTTKHKHSKRRPSSIFLAYYYIRTTTTPTLYGTLQEMEYSKCQQVDDEEENDDDNDYNVPEEEFKDEPATEQTRQQQQRRQHDDYYTDEKTNRKMAPLEMEESSSNANEAGRNYNEVDDDSDAVPEEDAVSLLGSDLAGDVNASRSTDGSMYSSTHSRRRSTRRGINHYRYNRTNEVTLREMAAVQGNTCCPLYFCIVVLLSLLVAAIFVAPAPPKSSSTAPADSSGGDSHYRSPASSAAHQQQQQQQLQCELVITTGTSWDAYVQNVSSSNNDYDGSRCIRSDQTQTTSCRCKNPTVPDFPQQDSYAKRWQQTFQQNLDRIAQWETVSSSSSAQSINNNNLSLDVVFLGDSITEHWVGTDLSKKAAVTGRPPDDDKWSGNVRVFHSLFGDTSVPVKSSTTNLMGMPLGISGDRCPNLLYRLQNGELPESLLPSVFWILIGTNDVGADNCRASQVIAGTIAIVKYIQQKRPNTKIVLNSILPRGRPNTMQFWYDMYQPINDALDCYVHGFQNNNDVDNDDHPGKLYFFNATDLFLTSDSQSINYTLLPDGLHPGEEGSWIWGRAMVEKIQEILSPT